MIFLQFFNIYFPFSFPYRIRYHRFPKQQLFKQGRGIPAALRPPAGRILRKAENHIMRAVS